MQLKFEKDTAGVLLFCSKIGLKNYFANRAFDYNFPEGILPLIEAGIVAAVVTESGEDVTGEIRIMEGINDKPDYQLATGTKFRIEENDEILVLSHSEFTTLCADKKGDVDNFDFWSEKITLTGLKTGWAFAFIHYQTFDESPYLDIIFQLAYSNIEPPAFILSEHQPINYV